MEENKKHPKTISGPHTDVPDQEVPYLPDNTQLPPYVPDMDDVTQKSQHYSSFPEAQTRGLTSAIPNQHTGSQPTHTVPSGPGPVPSGHQFLCPIPPPRQSSDVALPSGFQANSAGSVISYNRIVAENVNLTKEVGNRETANRKAHMEEVITSGCSSFVETTGYTNAKDCLDACGHLTLIGEAGSGKTTIAYRLLKFYKDSSTFTPLIVDDVSKIKSKRDPEEPTLVLVKDVFGRSAYTPDKLDTWLTVFLQLQKTLKLNKFRIIFTSRNYIFHEAFPDLILFKDSLFRDNSIVDLSHNACLLMSEKEALLRMFARTGDVPIKDDDIELIINMKAAYGFPHACDLFSKMKMWHSQPVEFFKKPIDVFIESVQHFSSRDPEKFAVLLLVLLSGGEFNLAKLKQDDSLLDIVKNYMSNDRSFVRRLYQIAKPLIGSYLTSSRDILSFRHTTVEDTVAYVIGDKDPLFLLEHCSMRVLFDRVRIQTSQKQESTKSDPQWFHVVLSNAYQDHLIDRFVSDIETGNFPLGLLHQACSDAKFVERLFSNLALRIPNKRYLHMKDPENAQNILYWAAMNKNTLVLVRCLAETSYKLYEQLNAIIACCVTGNASALEFIFKNMDTEQRRRLLSTAVIGRDVGVEDQGTEQYDNLLNIASHHGNKRVVGVLVQFGFSVNGGNTVTPPLHSACEVGHVDILDYLHELGADLEVKTPDGKTPLHVCCENGHFPAVRKCTELGAGVNTPDKTGMTPMLTAYSNGYEQIAQFLITRGADKKAEDKLGRSQLYYGCVGGCAGIILKILERNITLSHRRFPRGFTLLHITVRKLPLGKEEEKKVIVQRLVHLGADVNAADESGVTPLLEAAENGYLKIAALLYQMGANANVADEKGQTIYHKFAKGGKFDNDILLERKTDINVKDVDGFTPLHLAGNYGTVGLMRKLLDFQVDVNAEDVRKRTPLHHTSESGSSVGVKLLLLSGALVSAEDDNKQTPLHLAAAGNTETLQTLLENGANVDCKDLKLKTPLHVAAYLGATGCVKSLLAKGASIDVADEDGKTPLHLAAESKSGGTDTLQLLLSKTPTEIIDKADISMHSPLHTAAGYGTTDAVEVLLDHGADVFCRNRLGKTPLHLAAGYGRNDHAMLLLSRQEEIDIKDDKGQTPLHVASGFGNTDTAELLIKQGADINAVDEKHKLPLHLAAGFDRTDTVYMLLKYEGDLNARDENNQTPLHLAAQYGGRHTVMALVQNRNVDVNAVNSKLQTPLHLAALHGKPDNIKVLLDHGADASVLNYRKRTARQLAEEKGHSAVVCLLQSDSE